ncbi:hypothetical protein BB560_003923 [Smittium megazygosporum]|uniref:LSM complex subunit LSm2 n=1 Tax=Smittium megazygosporum TaxID=133381 RepID=A0A2T9ZAS2_9FUNG|nr:hypothetical protein BB560_003923 [Smittium megazygosporum]
MLFHSFFSTLIGKKITLHLKNDVSIEGTLTSIDQFLNVKLEDIKVHNADKYPHLLFLKNIFVRGSVIRYVDLPFEEVDTALLQDATRREAQLLKQKSMGDPKTLAV